VKGIRCAQVDRVNHSNHAYFPILVEAGYSMSRDDLFQKLKDNGIHPRRYFYPLITDFPMYRGLPSAHPDRLPVAIDAANRILCLPIFPDLDTAQIGTISRLIAG